MKQILIIFAGGAIAVSAIALGFTYLQTYQERTSLEGDLQYRTHLLVDSLIESVQPAYNANVASYHWTIGPLSMSNGVKMLRNTTLL